MARLLSVRISDSHSEKLNEIKTRGLTVRQILEPAIDARHAEIQSTEIQSTEIQSWTVIQTPGLQAQLAVLQAETGAEAQAIFEKAVELLHKRLLQKRDRATSLPSPQHMSASMVTDDAFDSFVADVRSVLR